MKILVNTNGKKYSEQAMHFAGRLFSPLKPLFTVLYIQEPFSLISEELAKKYLERGEEIFSEYNIQVKTKLKKGLKAEQIVKESEKGGFDLIVLGSRGTAQALRSLSEYNIGQVSNKVVSVIKNSFLLVRDPPKSLRRVLICTDGSQDSVSAVRFWAKLNKKQKNTDIQVNIVNVIPEFYSRFKDFLEPVAEEQIRSLETLPHVRTRYLFEAKEILRKEGIRSRIRLREGNITEEILKESERNYDLVVMGLRGRKEKRKENIGRHALRIVRRAKTSVLVIKK